MFNKYCVIDGAKKIKDTFSKITAGFALVEADVVDIGNRVDTIITTPIDGAGSAEELLDARGGEATLGIRLGGFDSHLADNAINVKSFGAKGDWNGTTGTDDLAAFMAAVDYCVANKRTLFIPFGKREVYRITGVLDFKNIPVIGSKPLGIFVDLYTQTASTPTACLYLETATAQIKNMPFARHIGISSKRTVNNISSVKFDNRPTLFWYDVVIAHSGLYGIELPYGAIPLFLDHVDIFRPKVYGIFIEGATLEGLPDSDTNRVHIKNSHISYSNGHGLYYNATGGIFTVENSDITGSGEPTNDSGGAGRNANAFAVYIAAESGANNVGYSFKNLWLESNNNQFYFKGTLAGVEIDNIKMKPFVNGEGTVFKLEGYLYSLSISNVKGTQLFQNFYDFDGLAISDVEVFRTFEEKNNVSALATNKRKLGTNSFNVARKLGEYSLQTYPAGTVVGSGASGANTYYTINTANLADPRKPFTENPAIYVDGATAGNDISVYIGGVYAGEIYGASATTVICSKNVAIGTGSIEFRVKKKIYADGTYYQPTIGKS